MTTRRNRYHDENKFVEAMYFQAFGKDLPANWNELPTRERRYISAFCSAAKKLTKSDIAYLVNVVDGLDFDGSSLQQPFDEVERLASTIQKEVPCPTPS